MKKLLVREEMSQCIPYFQCLFKQLQALSQSDKNKEYCDETLPKTETHLKKKVYDQILKGAIAIMILTTMIGFFIVLSEDSGFQGEVLQFPQVNLTENPTTSSTTTMTSTSTTGKCSLPLLVISPFISK